MPHPFNIPHARLLLQNGDFARLFREELGWEPDNRKLTLPADGRDFAFSAFAKKSGFTAWLCECPEGQLPLHHLRMKLDKALTETHFEHLIVFATPDRARQSWLWVRREHGKPLAARTHEFFHAQPGDSLLQKLDALHVSLEEEETGIDITQITGRVRAAFDVERVTKKFYRDFDDHRKAFVKFITGIATDDDRALEKKLGAKKAAQIPDEVRKRLADCDWYASVMLNRLMFVYFIQRKGFLDGDHDYLKNRLARCRLEHGQDKFYSFYRYFLLRLFREGFGKRRTQRSADFEKILGKIPYLNGGLFDTHELERDDRYGKTIEISDAAFARVFAYFDQYQWHLDERPLRADNEINPDVLGYIFEKYINQKQMGAYYTKEDITEYIGKNTILPFLLDAAQSKGAGASSSQAREQDAPSPIWSHLRETPDRYIHAPVRHGADKPLPPEIEQGIDTTAPNLRARRAEWNRPAPADYALPAEIWRETIARRQRCAELRRKLAAGEVRSTSDLITLNLDIRQFTQDAIARCDSPALLRAFWTALEKVTILDPTCGSGAFLFAALNLLEPLYESCLDRMESFLGDHERTDEKHTREEYADFRKILARVTAHPNRRYFILKSIILQNLYGVDIMEEAVEICKLRLFLKLASQISPDETKDNLGIEPLPDIDFNIRAGNTLVGYTTLSEVQNSLHGRHDLELIQDIDRQILAFRRHQSRAFDAVEQQKDKQVIHNLRAEMRDKLDYSLFVESGAPVFGKWRETHQPFHWFAEFNSIIQNGGFDIIIGNPPYVEIGKIDYSLATYKTRECGNLYAPVIERACEVARKNGWFGMIIPHSSICTNRMLPVTDLLSSNSLWTSSYDIRPSKLFDGVDQRLLVFILKNNRQKEIFTSNYHRWNAEARCSLFQSIEYIPNIGTPVNDSIAKAAYPIEHGIIAKIKHDKKLSLQQSNPGSRIYYHNAPRYFVRAMPRAPYFWNGKDGEKIQLHIKMVSFEKASDAALAGAALNSSLFYWWFILFSNCRDLTSREIDLFPFSLAGVAPENRKKLVVLFDKLNADYEHHKVRKKCFYKATGEVIYDEYYPKISKPIIDEIDTIMAAHYGLTEEELDFIINYDIKYRMGGELDSEEQ